MDLVAEALMGGELGLQVAEMDGFRRRAAGGAGEEKRVGGEAGMVQEKACEFATGVAADAEDGDAWGVVDRGWRDG